MSYQRSNESSFQPNQHSQSLLLPKKVEDTDFSFVDCNLGQAARMNSKFTNKYRIELEEVVVKRMKEAYSKKMAEYKKNQRDEKIKQKEKDKLLKAAQKMQGKSKHLEPIQTLKYNYIADQDSVENIVSQPNPEIRVDV